MRPLVSSFDIGCNCQPTWVGVLHDHGGRFGKSMHERPRSVGIKHVEIRHLFAAKLFGTAPPTAFAHDAISRATLMWVFAITQRRLALQLQGEPLRQGVRLCILLCSEICIITSCPRKPRSNLCVICRSHCKCTRGKLLASARTQGARCAQLGEHLAILCAISHHCDTRMVLGRPTHQRRATDINQLDAWFCIKRIQTHCHQINRRNIVSL